MATTARITADEFLARPGDDRFSQLIGGEVVVNAPTWGHQGIVCEIAAVFLAWTRGAPGRGASRAGVGLRLSDSDVFVPDLLWLAADKVPDPHAPAQTVKPDFAVEVRSPSTWRYDVGPKKTAYERAGLRELWLVDPPAETVIVFRRSRSGAPEFDVLLEVTPPEPLTSPHLPGFSLDLARLFG